MSRHECPRLRAHLIPAVATEGLCVLLSSMHRWQGMHGSALVRPQTITIPSHIISFLPTLSPPVWSQLIFSHDAPVRCPPFPATWPNKKWPRTFSSTSYRCGFSWLTSNGPDLGQLVRDLFRNGPPDLLRKQLLHPRRLLGCNTNST